MNTSLQQLSAVTHYDFLIHWRQRTILLSYIVLTVTCLGVALLSGASGVIGLPEDMRLQASTSSMAILYPVIHIFSIFLLPLVMADTFARDRQYEMRELLIATPMANSVYALGKLFGLFLTITLGTLTLAFALGAVWWLLIHPFDVGVYLNVWLLRIYPVMLLNGGLAVLVAAGQPTRRGAVTFAMAFGILSVFMLGVGMGYETQILDYFNLGRPVMLKSHVLSLGRLIPTAATLYIPLSMNDFLITIGAGALELALAYLLVQRWLNRSET